MFAPVRSEPESPVLREEIIPQANVAGLSAGDPAETETVINPYSHNSFGVAGRYTEKNIKDAIANNGKFDYKDDPVFKMNFDLRNPKNTVMRKVILMTFGLDPQKSTMKTA